MNIPEFDQFKLLAYRLEQKYDLKKIKEHDTVFTFELGGAPLFRLVFANKLDVFNNKNILLSFHVMSTAYEGVIWYLKTKELYSDIVLAPVYFEDKHGNIHFGEDASYIKFDQLRENIVKDYQKNMGKYMTNERVHDTPKNFTDMEAALRQFYKMVDKEKENE